MGFLFSYRGFCWGEGNRKKKKSSYARGDNHAAAPRVSCSFKIYESLAGAAPAYRARKNGWFSPVFEVKLN